MDVRTSRSVKPKGMASLIRLASAMVPPRGAMASPRIVTSNDPPRSGRCRRKRATSALVRVTKAECDLADMETHVSAGGEGIAQQSQGIAGSYDTEKIDRRVVLCHIARTGLWGLYVHARVGLV